MRNRIIHNIQTNTIQVIEVDDNYILSIHGKEVEITLGNNTPLINQTINVNLQLYTPPLTNNLRNTLNDNITVTMQFGDVIQDVNLINGVFSDSIVFVTSGVFIIKCLSHISNSVEVIVT